MHAFYLCLISLDIRPKACNFIKKESLAQVFLCEFCETSKNTFFTEHLRLLLLLFQLSEEYLWLSQTPSTELFLRKWLAAFSH